MVLCGQMLTSGRLSEEKKQELEANAKMWSACYQTLKWTEEEERKDGGAAGFNTKGRGRKAEQWLKRSNGGFTVPLSKSILSYLLSKFNEGGGRWRRR